MSDPIPDTPAANHSGGFSGGGLLSKKIHGIPVVPVALVSAAAIGFVLYRRHKAGTVPADAVAGTPTTAVTDDSTTLPDNGGGFSGNDQSALDTLTTGNGVGSSTTTSLTLTNQQWATNAINGLVGQGQNSPTDIQNAIQNGVNGVPLANPQQLAIWNAAIAAYGEPPESILQTSLGPQIAQVTSGFHPYTVKKGDTIDSVLQSTYGTIDSQILNDFFGVNTGIQSYDSAGGKPILITSGTNASDAPSANQKSTLRVGQTLHLPIFTEGILP